MGANALQDTAEKAVVKVLREWLGQGSVLGLESPGGRRGLGAAVGGGKGGRERLGPARAEGGHFSRRTQQERRGRIGDVGALVSKQKTALY